MASSGHNHHRQPREASIILPLYVYPSAGAWAPLYELASSYPHVQFTAIVNPHNGPGEGSLPNEDYTQAIKALNSMDNVRTIGYVATTWCRKDLNSVLDEVARYAGWGNSDSSLALSGIFFDETPTRYAPEYVSYLQKLSQVVRSQRGLKDGFIVHNPGALPEAQYFGDPNLVEASDLTVVFEDAYANWIGREVELRQATQSYDGKRLAILVHTTPSLTSSDTKAILQRILAIGQSIWLTETSNYTELDSHFSVLVNCLNEHVS